MVVTYIFPCIILARSLNSSAGPKQRAQNKTKSTPDHGGRQQSTLEVRRNTPGARATAADALATSPPMHLPLFAKKNQGVGASLWHLKVGVQSVTCSCYRRCGMVRPIAAHSAEATDARGS